MEDQAKENTDIELWREPTDEPGMSYYQPSIHVTREGGIGINVGGMVIVMPLSDWHKLAINAPDPNTEGAKSGESTGPAQASPGFTLALERLLEEYKLATQQGILDQGQIKAKILTAHQESVREIIGDFEVAMPYHHRGFTDLTETSLIEATENVRISARNLLRTEQRLRAGLEE